MPKTYKTWELLKMATEYDGYDKKPEDRPHFKRKGCHESVTFAKNVFDDYGLSDKSNSDLLNFYLANEEWELIPQPVDFMTAANSGQLIYPEGCYSSDSLGLSGWLNSLASVSNDERLKLLNGKWFIKEEE